MTGKIRVTEMRKEIKQRVYHQLFVSSFREIQKIEETRKSDDKPELLTVLFPQSYWILEVIGLGRQFSPVAPYSAPTACLYEQAWREIQCKNSVIAGVILVQEEGKIVSVYCLHPYLPLYHDCMHRSRRAIALSYPKEAWQPCFPILVAKLLHPLLPP